MASKWYSVVVDCDEPAVLANWWAQALDYNIIYESAEEYVIAGGTKENPVYPGLLFILVPEGKSAKNRLHIDLNPDDQDAEVARLEGLGAKRVDIGQKDVPWVVMADPAGNEFCVLTARAQG